MANILEEKGLLGHELDGPRNVYFPTVKLERARRSALDHVIETFFGGSTPKLVAALLDSRGNQLTPEDRLRLAAMIDEAAEKEEKP
jgi:predicted transcriptional regulator